MKIENATDAAVTIEPGETIKTDATVFNDRDNETTVRIERLAAEPGGTEE